jgi:hypothetical protein
MEHWFTVLVITPGVFDRRQEILADLSFRGFRVKKAKTCRLSTEQATLLLEDQPKPCTDLTDGLVMVLRLEARNPAYNPVERVHCLLRPPDNDSPNSDNMFAKYAKTCDVPFVYTRTWESAICYASVLDLY